MTGIDEEAKPPRIAGLYNSGYYYEHFLKAGIDTFSKAEQLAYMVLETNNYFH